MPAGIGIAQTIDARGAGIELGGHSRTGERRVSTIGGADDANACGVDVSRFHQRRGAVFHVRLHHAITPSAASGVEPVVTVSGRPAEVRLQNRITSRGEKTRPPVEREVIARVTSPRFPCVNVNFQMQNSKAVKKLNTVAQTGVYFEIVKGGRIFPDSPVSRIKQAKVPFPISKVYDKVMKHVPVTQRDLDRAKANGAFPKDRLKMWKDELNDVGWLF